MRLKLLSAIALLFIFSLYPEVVEAYGRGGRRGGESLFFVLLIPFFIASIVGFINKNFPRVWDVLLGSILLFFATFFFASILEWIGILENEEIIPATLFIYFVILFGPFVMKKIRAILTYKLW
ncbi:hypothetical protein [Alteromonas sp. ASW11-130]|uniref:hypothetical protein n=1 Tax=Alteromonas sp. ASW11-130 TaxID=3015775 RepID=UPI00224249CA|nr:hypothetical protein [Alteromonas sp. ASW11-130]MCW8091020.1 hypothetical protein [Alteromonas sp. ASW11-130]